MNNRVVQGTFDDLNPETAVRWAYSDTGKWDAERNNREFLAAMPEWKKHGVLAFTVNFQGGSPEGYSKGQPWENHPFTADGRLAAAVPEHVSWGWFDWRRQGESFDEGYQSVPVNRGISSERKRAFHRRVAEITGTTPVPATGGTKPVRSKD